MSPCPDCRGRGWRIVTQDGTRPACISCGGTGRLSFPQAGAANAPATLPPPAPQEAGRRPFPLDEVTR